MIARQPCPASFCYLLAFMAIAYGPGQSPANGLREQIDALLAGATRAGFAHVDLITTLIANGEKDTPRVLHLATALGETIGDAVIIKFIEDLSTSVKASMSILSTPAAAPAGTMTPSGADFAQITPEMFAIAARLGIEIVGCAKGFNAWKNEDILSGDCTPGELWQWMQGFDCGKDEEKVEQDDRAAPPSATNFTDVEFQAVMKHVRYRGWAMLADHTGVKITGANFTAHAANSAEFFSFVHGFNAAGAALGMLSTGDAADEGEDE